jgi:hypothetical protein
VAAAERVEHYNSHKCHELVPSDKHLREIVSTGVQNMEILLKCRKRRKKNIFSWKVAFNHKKLRILLLTDVNCKRNPSPLQVLSLLSVSITGFNDDHGHFL